MAKKTMPFDASLEASAIGCLLVDPESCLSIAIKLGITSEIFYLPLHVRVFETAIHLHTFGLPVDIITVSNRINKECIGDSEKTTLLLSDCIDKVSTTAHFEYYIEELSKIYVSRKSIVIYAEACDRSFAREEAENVMAFVEDHTKKLTKYMGQAPNATHLISQTTSVLQQQINLASPVVAKVASSIPDIRNRIMGWPVGRMSIIASRPGVGKTALACTETLGIAKRGEPVSVLTKEMSADEFTGRMACIEAQVNLGTYIDGRLDTEEKDKISEALDVIAGLPIRINDNIMNIRQVHEWMIEEAKHSRLGILDHFLWIKRTVSKKFRDKTDEYNAMSKTIATTAKDANIAMVVLHQIHRINAAFNKGKSDIPTKSNLKEAGGLEEDAYLIALLHDKPVDSRRPESGNYQIIIDKHRNGWHGTLPIFFVPETAQFMGLKTGRNHL